MRVTHGFQTETLPATVRFGGRLPAAGSASANSYVLREGAQLADQSIIFGVWSNPEPHDTFRPVVRQHPVVQTDAGRPEAANPLEVERRVIRVQLQQSKVLVRKITHLFWQSIVEPPKPGRGEVLQLRSLSGGGNARLQSPGLPPPPVRPNDRRECPVQSADPMPALETPQTRPRIGSVLVRVVA